MSLCNLLVYHYAGGEIILKNINNNNKENLALRDVLNVLKGSYLKLVHQSCTQASYRMNQQGQQVRQIEILERSLVFFFCAAWVIDLILACSRLRDSGGKSFSKKKCKTRAGAGVPPPPPPFPVASYFRLFSSPLYYLRAWHGLLSFKVSSLNAWSCYSF